MSKKAYLLVAASFLTAATAVPGAQPSRTVWDRVYDNEQSDRGAQLYERQCGRCHGDDLSGVEAAPALTGADFGATWEGLPLADLFERMRTSMPQDKPGSLSRAQNADILAYMLRVGGFPAGDKPLESGAGALAQITYRLYRPQ